MYLSINAILISGGSSLDNITTINCIEVEPIDVMLSKIDWNRFYENAIPSYFHGDLQPENILYLPFGQGIQLVSLLPPDNLLYFPEGQTIQLI